MLDLRAGPLLLLALTKATAMFAVPHGLADCVTVNCTLTSVCMSMVCNNTVLTLQLTVLVD